MAEARNPTTSPAPIVGMVDGRPITGYFQGRPVFAPAGAPGTLSPRPGLPLGPTTNPVGLPVGGPGGGPEETAPGGGYSTAPGRFRGRRPVDPARLGPVTREGYAPDYTLGPAPPGTPPEPSYPPGPGAPPAPGEPGAPGGGGPEEGDGGGGGGGGGFEISEEERALLRQIGSIIGTQQEGLQAQLEQFRRLAPFYESLFVAQSDVAYSQLAAEKATLPARFAAYMDTLDEMRQDPRQRALVGASWEDTLKTLQGGGLDVAPEQKALLDKIYGERREEGMKTLRQSAEELAASRGLRLTDTPIGGDVFLREAASFERGLEAERAGAELGLGTQQQQLRTAVGQFQQQLHQSALAQRANLASGGIFGSAGKVGGAVAPPTVGGGSDAGAGASLFSAISGQRASAQQNALQRDFLAGQNAADRQNRMDVANVNRRPGAGAMDYIAAFAPLVGGALSLF